MPPASRLGRQIAEVAAALNAIGARFALIGGLALASHKVVRATQDVDLLTDAEKADAIDAELSRLGYRRLHRSAEAANYARGDERVDFLYARRPAAQRLLADAVELKTALGDLRVVSAEGLIGFKQSAEPPFAADAGLSAPVQHEEDPYQALDDLMAAVEILCPVWPPRSGFVNGGRMLL